MLKLRDRLAGLCRALEAYERDFEWFCFCLACGHVPAGGYLRLQELYLAHASSLRPGSEIFPLVCAHWDAVNAAHEMAAARNPGYRLPAQDKLREAKARHREAARALRAAWAG